jgi:hypothetical protein
MKDDINAIERSLEKATAAKREFGEVLAPETASLRETWLMFGQMLDAAAPTESPVIVRRKIFPPSRRRWRLYTFVLVAASLFAAIAAVSMMRERLSTSDSIRTRDHGIAVQPQGTPSQPARAVAKASSEEPQWNDSLDDQFAQIDWTMACIQQNQLFRTDAFGVVEYQIERLGQAIQADVP